MASFVHLKEGDCNWHNGDVAGHEYPVPSTQYSVLSTQFPLCGSPPFGTLLRSSLLHMQSQNPHPVAQNATRVGQPEWGTRG